MRAIQCHIQGCPRRGYGQRTAQGRPRDEVCAKVWAEAEESVNQLILDARQDGVQDAIAHEYQKRARP